MLNQTGHSAVNQVPDCSSAAHEFALPQLDWSVIIPFHNERSYLPQCLESLARQSCRARLVLVDNGSTDGSGDLARELCAKLNLDAVHVYESRPGKVAALQRGLEQTETRYVATCDADTIYPPEYLKIARLQLTKLGVVAAVAATTPIGSGKWANRVAGLRMKLTSQVLPQQCLNGGAGQVFRTAALKACGGFDPAIWNWVLEDHEIMARIEQFGLISYDHRFVCHPAERPRGTDCTGWKLSEQLRYHLTRGAARREFFHVYLANQLRLRSLPSEMLRRPVLAPAVA